MRRRHVCRTLLALAGALAAGGVRGRTPDAQIEPWTGPPQAPPLVLRTVDGAPFDLTDWRGHAVLANFWATWCEPCIEEMPALLRVQQRFAPRGLRVVAVNLQEGEPRIRGFVQKVAVPQPIVRDTDGAVARAWGARIFPATYLLDPAHRIRYHVRGAIDWDSPAVDAVLAGLVATPQ